MAAAVASCKKAYADWSKTTILTRQQHMFRLQNLVKQNLVSLLPNNFYTILFQLHFYVNENVCVFL